jgi:hypothetical protein
VRSEHAEPLVFPPDIFGASAVMRDTQAALALTTLEAPVAQERSEDDLT